MSSACVLRCQNLLCICSSPKHRSVKNMIDSSRLRLWHPVIGGATPGVCHRGCGLIWTQILQSVDLYGNRSSRSTGRMNLNCVLLNEEGPFFFINGGRTGDFLFLFQIRLCGDTRLCFQKKGILLSAILTACRSEGCFLSSFFSSSRSAESKHGLHIACNSVQHPRRSVMGLQRDI